MTKHIYSLELTLVNPDRVLENLLNKQAEAGTRLDELDAQTIINRLSKAEPLDVTKKPTSARSLSTLDDAEWKLRNVKIGSEAITTYLMTVPANHIVICLQYNEAREKPFTLYVFAGSENLAVAWANSTMRSLETFSKDTEVETEQKVTESGNGVIEPSKLTDKDVLKHHLTLLSDLIDSLEDHVSTREPLTDLIVRIRTLEDEVRDIQDRISESERFEVRRDCRLKSPITRSREERRQHYGRSGYGDRR